MNANQTKAQMLEEKNIYDTLHNVTYSFVIITADGSHSTGYFGPPRTLKELFEELTEYYQSDNYHTAFVTPMSSGILKLIAKKPVEITKEKLERIIENIDFLSK